MYCAQCGIEGKASAKFCARCGRPLISRDKPATQSMHCTQCGKIYGTDHQFCAEDGSQLQPQENIISSSSIPPPEVKKSPFLKIVLLVFSLFFIAALSTGGYLYFSGRWVNIPVIAKLFTPPSMQRSQTKIEDSSSSELVKRFCGIWEYDEQGSKQYLKIIKAKSGKFKLSTGYKYEGQIVFNDPMVLNSDGIYLRPLNGKLVGKFTSSNFYATHGMDFIYRITLEMKSKNKLIYTVWSEIRGETDKREATKISD